MTGMWGYIAAAVAISVTAVIMGLALAVLKALFDGTISLKYLIAEPADPHAQALAQAGHQHDQRPPEVPKASMSRFQLLVFTFVIGGVYLVLCLESGTLVDVPQNVILLLGVSGGTYAASKGIKTAGESRATGMRAPGDPAAAPAVPPPPAPAPSGSSTGGQ